MSDFFSALDKLEFEKVRQRLLSYASSGPGRDVLHAITISTSVSDIHAELSLVSEVKRLLEEEEAFPLEGIHPVRGAIAKAGVEGAALQGKELAQIFATMRAARLLRAFLAKRHTGSPRVWEIAGALFTDKVLEFNLEHTVDETGAVLANASKELQSIRRAIADRYEQLKRRLEGILKSVSEQGFSQEDIITTREGRMVIPVKSEHKNRVHGFIHSASASGATVFIEPSETLELNNEIRSLQFQEQREIERILRELTRQIGESREPLQRNLSILAHLDALHAKAKYSLEVLGVQPVVTEEGTLRLTKARHPILLMMHGYRNTVPLDIELGNGFTTLVISGPNAGGKSVAMKCAGLLVLMVQAGLHIPVSDLSVVRVFRRMFVDIGDEQSIENDLSTFSSHLRNLKSIAESADDRSLVLIDEIGSGTDPLEGGAIAAALLESLTRRGTLTIATTHHSSLKAFAHETDGVENGAMEFDQSTLTPTYVFKPGIPGSSYALEMASRLGFDHDTLERSRALLGSQHVRLDRLLAELETSTQKYRRDSELLQAEQARLAAMAEQYESKIAALKDELKALKRQALDEATEILDKANAVIEQSIKEIREKAADRAVVREVREHVDQMRQEIVHQKAAVVAATTSEDVGNTHVGAFVRLKEGTEAGEVASIAPDGKSAVILFGSVKMKVPTADLLPARKRGGTLRPVGVPEAHEKPREVQQDLDLRGMTGEEALPLVDKFIDNALLAGLHRVDIIHGKGTGALRKKVTEYLSNSPRIKSFRLGEWNEGGTGATVVEL